MSEEDMQGVSLTQSLTDEGVSLTQSLTDGPAGYKKITAFVKDDSDPKKKGAARQKKSEDEKKNAGMKRAWVPEKILLLAELHGWDLVLKRAEKRGFFSWSKA
jgi:hypothetical protein